MRHSLLVLLSLAVVSVALPTACASRQTTEAVTEAVTDALVPVEDENELGKKMKKELDKELTLHPDEEVQAYVRTLGRKVVRAARGEIPEGITFRFHVVKDDETVNAFAIPGGDIYIYSGLMKLAEDEAELVSVLGHEVAHVTRRHIAQRLVGMYGYQSLHQLALGEDPGPLAELAANIVTSGMMLKHGRDHENDADVQGIRYAVGAGYDPSGFISMFERMKSAGDIEALEIFMSHPVPQSRIDNINIVLQTHHDAPTERGRDAYQAMKAKL